METGEEPLDLIRQIRTVDIITRARVTGQQAGVHISMFKGQGIEFSDLREYVPGDDIRAIDWKITARYGIPYIKEFAEERDQTYYLVLDLSGSGAFGNRVSKFRTMIQVLASIAFTAVRYHDRIGLIVVTDQVEKFIPARNGRKHAVHIIQTALNHEPVSKGSDLRPALHYLLGRIRRMASIIIISDFFVPDCSRELSLLAQRHEVMAISVYDNREGELPDVGLIQLEDAESGEQILADTSDPAFRERYRDAFLTARETVREMLLGNHVRSTRISTSDDWIRPLRRLFESLGVLEV